VGAADGTTRVRRRRVVVVGDRSNARAVALARALEPELAARCRVKAIDLDHEVDLRRVRADLVLVLGGDGSILETARRLDGNRVPLMGVNLGHLGFLATVSADEPPTRIAEHAAGPLEVEERGRLRVELVLKAGRTIAAGDAVNDAVLDRGEHLRLITIGVRVEDGPAFETRGDGLVVSTPTGSTAYSLAAGGPILHPAIDAVLVTPLCPHSLTNRPVAVPSESTIDLEVLEADGGARVSVDGRPARRKGLAVGDRVRVRRSQRPLRIAVLPGEDFYSRLRSKLHFARPAFE